MSEGGDVLTTLFLVLAYSGLLLPILLILLVVIAIVLYKGIKYAYSYFTKTSNNEVEQQYEKID